MVNGMCADVYANDNKENMDPKLFQQKKFDGVRAVMTLNKDRTDVIIYSRQLKRYKQFGYLRDDALTFLQKGEEIIETLYSKSPYFERIYGVNANVNNDNNHHKPPLKLYIDGEIYKHGMDLQDISGVARRQTSATTTQLYYHIYDCFVPAIPTLSFEERNNIISLIFDTEFKWLKPVETFEPKNEEEIQAFHQQALADNFEGSMIRCNSAYEYSYKGYHSKNLLKIKPKLDEEFKIVGFFAADKGRAAGCIMWECETNTDPPIKFSVTPMGTLIERKQLFTELSTDDNFKKKYYGKSITIKFDAYSKDQVPVRANAVAIRDYE